MKHTNLHNFWYSSLDYLKKQNWWVIGMLMILTIAVSMPIYYQRIEYPVDTDYAAHIMMAEQWLRNRSMPPGFSSHPVLQILLIGIYLLSRGTISLYHALIIVQVAVQVVIVLILYFWFGNTNKPWWNVFRALVSLSMSLVTPIMLLVPLDGFYYYGYIGLANYHNPTIHLLKPVALLSILMVIQAISNEKSSLWQKAISALLMILSACIKPNYTLTILPVLVLFGLFFWFYGKKIDYQLLIGGLIVPAIFVLAVQWLVTYQGGEARTSIILAPLAVEKSFSGYLFPKFLLSCSFPLAVLLIARRELLSNATLLVGWSGFLSGIGQLYLLAESGKYLLHGNFRWSAQIMLFLLFAICTRWLMREKILKSSMTLWEKLTTYGFYLTHVAGGIAYYIYCMVSVHYN